MRIAILGWGSLIPCPGELSFSRISVDGRLTLVIDPVHGTDVTTQYAESKHVDLAAAIEDLRKRKGTTRTNIGFCGPGEERSRNQQSLAPIRQWLNTSNFEAVIWTDLESNFADKRHVTFSLDAAFDYLNSLENVCQANARDYINRAPEQTHTALRQDLQSRGWL